MANTAEGITVGEEEGLDPNDPAQFAAIMEGRGVQKTDEDTDSPDRSIASGLTVAGPEQPGRGPDGRFVSNQEAQPKPDTPAPAATDTSGEEDGDGADDPEIADILAKYGGDQNAALKALANAQSLIGRRDEEREQLRETVARLEGQMQGLIAGGGPQAASTAALSDEQIEEVAAGRIQSLGYNGAAEEAANVAHTTGDDRALRTIMEQWQLESPYAAMDFLADFKAWQREQAAAATATPAEQPAWAVRAEEQLKVEQYGEHLVALKKEVGDDAFAQIAAKLDDALGQMPQNVLQMIDSQDAEARAAGFRIVADRASRLAAANPIQPPAPEGGQPVVDPAVARKLAGSRVASGALRPPEKAAPATDEQSVEEAKVRFKRAIIEAPTTSIASGLTYGPTP